MHIENTEEREWLQERIEDFGLKEFSPKFKFYTFRRLCRNETFQNFLADKFTTTKRFGIEGVDTVISGLGAITDRAVFKYKSKRIVLAMAHRGRLNILACVHQKPLETIFGEIQDQHVIGSLKLRDQQWGTSGDVKYHLGVTTTKDYGDEEIELTILPNPSHLETVNPVQYGVCRAYQDAENDYFGDNTFGVLIHGDAALAGQGVVYEHLQMQDLKGYSPKGTIHIVANNQVGFTTTLKEIRVPDTPYCTEIGKTVESPIFHINADEPDIVDYFMQLSVDYRMKFKKDIFIDVVGYRKYGHNELDQPAFTQPLMYQKIKTHQNVYQKYRQKLINDKVLTENEIKNLENELQEWCLEGYKKAQNMTHDQHPWTVHKWSKILQVENENTNLDYNYLQELGIKQNTIPDSFSMHNQLKKIFKKRLDTLQKGEGIDMATAEGLAFGSLLDQKYGVRLSGQDVERGTFSHRHAILTDQKNDSKYNTLEQFVQKTNVKCTIVNSHLSEYGVLGFEYGYSLIRPNHLVLWEAQFGDFANGAQIIIDNYISSAESKWQVQSCIVLLLPNGMDGQGPEHSSARVERFLQLNDEDYDYARQFGCTHQSTQELIEKCNWQVVNCTTTANYFHVLRRQMIRNYRKPLIAMTSKRQLRLARACSNLSEFSEQKCFKVIITDSNPNQVSDDQVKRVCLLTGQVYYDVQEYQEKHNKNDIAIIRVEQLAPFPYTEIKNELARYPNADHVWCQEEHQNQGGYHHADPRLEVILEELDAEKKVSNTELKYAGRIPSASPATGSPKLHKMQLDELLEECFNY